MWPISYDWIRETYQQVKWLMPEVDPQNASKDSRWMVHTCNPDVGEAELWSPWGSQACQPILIVKFQDKWETLPPKPRCVATDELYSRLFSGLHRHTHRDIYALTYTWTHTHTVLVRASIDMIKLWPKATWGREGLLGLQFHITVLYCLS